MRHGLITMSLLLFGLLTVMPSKVAHSLDMAADRPIVIAHRGASGYLPEHTLAAYRLGIEQGADFIEPDLVMTRDGVLIARHDIYLSTTTDVADHPEFANRKRHFDGKNDWFVFDFTYAEITALRAVQPFADRDPSHNGRYPLPTFDDIVELVTHMGQAHGRRIGLYPEMKRPAAFEAQGLQPLNALSQALTTARDRNIPLFFQCFDPEFLMRFAGSNPDPAILLIGAKTVSHADGHRLVPEVDFRTYSQALAGIGISKALLTIGLPAGQIVRDAHAAGLKVHVWTLRDDRVAQGFASASDELTAMLAFGIDGVFSDFPDTAVKTVASFKTRGTPQ